MGTSGIAPEVPINFSSLSPSSKLVYISEKHLQNKDFCTKKYHNYKNLW